MENYVDMLNHLIKQKRVKKKEPNTIERKQFIHAWTDMLYKEGYTAAEEYLYDGFIYCGASPLKDYIKSSNDCVESLNAIFRGKKYGENCAITVSILFHLLALLLSEKNINLRLVGILMHRIPAALMNKERKIYGQADRALKKYFLDELHCDKMPSIESLVAVGENKYSIREFGIIINEIIAKMQYEGYSQKTVRNIEFLKDWIKEINEDIEGNNDSDLKCKEDKITDKTQVENNMPNELPVGEQVMNSENKSDLKRNEQAIELDKYKKEIIALKEELNKVITIKDSQKDTIQRMQSKLLGQNEKISNLNDVISEKDFKIFELNEKCSEHVQMIEGLEYTLSQKENELNERAQMMEALSRDRAKQSDESLNRLASKLKVEYRDFKDAVDIPMDSDLGENMREQLRNVFDILIKSGVTIND